MTLEPKIPIHVTKPTGGRVTVAGDPRSNLAVVLKRAHLIRGQICSSMTCLKCHVYVDKSGALQDEEAIIKTLLNRGEDSRLACRIQVTDADAGMEVEIVPED